MHRSANLALRLKSKLSGLRIKQATITEVEAKATVESNSTKAKTKERKGENHGPEGGLSHQKTRLYVLFSEIATLIVGADKVPFNAHKRMLCDASPFFQAGCKPEWLKDNIITLPDDSPEAAQVMLYWIYHHKLGVPKRLFHGPKSLDIGDGLETAPGLLVKVFILREKYQMPKLRNDSLDTFRYWCGEHEENAKVPGKVIKYAFDNIPDTSHSKLCRLLLIIASSSFSSSDFTLLKDALSFEFFFQLTSLLSELIQNEAEIDLIDPGVWCPMFHTHGAGHPLCADVKDYTLVSEDDE